MDDGNAEKAKQHRLDLHAKLATMQCVVLILLGKQAPRGKFTNRTFQILGDIIAVFGDNAHLHYHFVIGFSCCDEFDKSKTVVRHMVSIDKTAMIVTLTMIKMINDAD